MKRPIVFCVVIFFVLSGFTFGQAPGAPSRPTPQPVTFVEKPVPSGKAIVYVYRPTIFFGAAIYPLVVSNNGPEGVLPSGHYLAIEADPGLLKLGFASTTSSALTVEVVAGESYFVRFDFAKPYVVTAQVAKTMTQILALKEWKMGDATY